MKRLAKVLTLGLLILWGLFFSYDTVYADVVEQEQLDGATANFVKISSLDSLKTWYYNHGTWYTSHWHENEGSYVNNGTSFTHTITVSGYDHSCVEAVNIPASDNDVLLSDPVTTMASGYYKWYRIYPAGTIDSIGNTTTYINGKTYAAFPYTLNGTTAGTVRYQLTVPHEQVSGGVPAPSNGTASTTVSELYATKNGIVVEVDPLGGTYNGSSNSSLYFSRALNYTDTNLVKLQLATPSKANYVFCGWEVVSVVRDGTAPSTYLRADIDVLKSTLYVACNYLREGYTRVNIKVQPIWKADGTSSLLVNPANGENTQLYTKNFFETVNIETPNAPTGYTVNFSTPTGVSCDTFSILTERVFDEWIKSEDFLEYGYLDKTGKYTFLGYNGIRNTLTASWTNKPVQLPTASNDNGEVFLGWYTKPYSYSETTAHPEDFIGAGGSYVSFTEDTTLYPVFKSLDFTLTSLSDIDGVERDHLSWNMVEDSSTYYYRVLSTTNLNLGKPTSDWAESGNWIVNYPEGKTASDYTLRERLNSSLAWSRSGSSDLTSGAVNSYTYKAPITGWYDIILNGANGGSGAYSGGKGGSVSAKVYLRYGTQLTMGIGSVGSASNGSAVSGGITRGAFSGYGGSATGYVRVCQRGGTGVWWANRNNESAAGWKQFNIYNSAGVLLGSPSYNFHSGAMCNHGYDFMCAQYCNSCRTTYDYQHYNGGDLWCNNNGVTDLISAYGGTKGKHAVYNDPAGSGGGASVVYNNGTLWLGAGGGAGFSKNSNGGSVSDTLTSGSYVIAMSGNSTTGYGGAGAGRNSSWGYSGASPLAGYNYRNTTFDLTTKNIVSGTKSSSDVNGSFEIGYSDFRMTGTEMTVLSKDINDPNSPSDSSIGATDSTNYIRVTWNKPTDVGTTYKYHIAMFANEENFVQASSAQYATTTAGIGGYYYLRDSSATTDLVTKVNGKNVLNSEYVSRLTAAVDHQAVVERSSNTDMYLHIIAFDKQFNYSDTYTVKLPKAPILSFNGGKPILGKTINGVVYSNSASHDVLIGGSAIYAETNLAVNDTFYSKVVLQGTKIESVPAEPTLKGWLLRKMDGKYWSYNAKVLESTYYIDGNSTFNESENKEAYATWVQKQYKLLLNYNRPTDAAATMTGKTVDYLDVYYDKDIGQMPTPAIDGWDFVGWYIETGFYVNDKEVTDYVISGTDGKSTTKWTTDTKSYNSEEVGKDGNTDLVAKALWVPRTYYVRYNSGQKARGGSSDVPVSTLKSSFANNPNGDSQNFVSSDTVYLRKYVFDNTTLDNMGNLARIVAGLTDKSDYLKTYKSVVSTMYNEMKTGVITLEFPTVYTNAFSFDTTSDTPQSMSGYTKSLDAYNYIDTSKTAPISVVGTIDKNGSSNIAEYAKKFIVKYKHSEMYKNGSVGGISYNLRQPVSNATNESEAAHDSYDYWNMTGWLCERSSYYDGLVLTQGTDLSKKTGALKNLTNVRDSIVDMTAQWEDCGIRLPEVEGTGVIFLGWCGNEQVVSSSSSSATRFETSGILYGGGVGELYSAWNATHNWKYTTKYTTKGYGKTIEQDLTMYSWWNASPVLVDMYNGLFFEGQNINYEDLLKLVSVTDYEDDYANEALRRIAESPSISLEDLYIKYVQDSDGNKYEYKAWYDSHQGVGDNYGHNVTLIDEFDSSNWEKVSDVAGMSIEGMFKYIGSNSEVAPSGTYFFTEQGKETLRSWISQASLDLNIVDVSYEVSGGNPVSLAEDYNETMTGNASDILRGDYTNHWLDTSTSRVQFKDGGVVRESKDWYGYFRVKYKVVDKGILSNVFAGSSSGGTVLMPNSPIELVYSRQCKIKYNYAPMILTKSLSLFNDDTLLNSKTNFEKYVVDSQVVLDAEDSQSNIPWWSRDGKDLDKVIASKGSYDELLAEKKITKIKDVTLDSGYVYERRSAAGADSTPLQIFANSLVAGVDTLDELLALKSSDSELWTAITSFKVVFNVKDQWGKYASNEIDQTVSRGTVEPLNDAEIPDSEYYYQDEDVRSSTIILINRDRDLTMLAANVKEKVRFISDNYWASLTNSYYGENGYGREALQKAYDLKNNAVNGSATPTSQSTGTFNKIPVTVNDYTDGKYGD